MTAPRLEHDWYDRDLPAGVELGAGSWFHSAYAFLHCRSRQPRPLTVGRHSGVYRGSYFGLGACGEVHIGDYCTLVGVIFNVNGRVDIGNHCFLAHEVTIADSPWSAPNGPREPGRGPRTQIGNDVWIAFRAVILSGVTIGEGAVVGAGSVVAADVPPFALVAGTPARQIGDTRRIRA